MTISQAAFELLKKGFEIIGTRCDLPTMTTYYRITDGECIRECSPKEIKEMIR